MKNTSEGVDILTHVYLLGANQFDLEDICNYELASMFRKIEIILKKQIKSSSLFT